MSVLDSLPSQWLLDGPMGRIVGIRSPNGDDQMFAFEGGPSSPVSWDDVTDKPPVIAAGDDADEARGVLGFGVLEEVVSADAEDTGDWSADGAGVVALLNELKVKFNTLVSG